MSLSEEMLKRKTWAVVGATIDKQKYGYKIFKKLRDKDYTVYPINTGYDEIEGEKCYHSLKDLPNKPDVVDMVVNHRVGAGVIQEACELGIEYLWFQPGTWHDSFKEVLEENNVEYVKDCVLVALR